MLIPHLLCFILPKSDTNLPSAANMLVKIPFQQNFCAFIVDSLPLAGDFKSNQYEISIKLKKYGLNDSGRC